VKGCGALGRAIARKLDADEDCPVVVVHCC
jgi:hypothetical protein